MAQVNNPIIGHARGKVGSVVFSTWKGKNIIKEKPATVANPRTANQVANRSRFVAMIALAKLLRPLLPTGFREYASNVTWMNRFMTVNSSNDSFVYDELNTQWDIQYNRLVISEGSLFPTDFTAIASESANKITINYSVDSLGNQNKADQLCVLVVGQEYNKQILNAELRETGVFEINTPTGALQAGQQLFVICFFKTPDGLKVSNSIGRSLSIGA